MIKGETNFQQTFHLLFTCSPVIAQRSFENLQDDVKNFTIYSFPTEDAK